MKKNLFLFFTLVYASAHAGNSIDESNGASSLCGPIPAVCYPATISGGLGIGIYFVSLNQISNTSSNPPMLEDFTCTDSTWLVPGVAYPFEVHTGNVYEETLKAWIDFSNDGNFDSSELVYQDSALIYMHQGTITVPTNAIHTFTPIRMRIGSEYSGNFLNGCNDAYYGQYEDYTVYFGIGIGINDQSKKCLITIAPNPFKSSAKLEIGSTNLQTRGYDLKIYNTLGKLVFHEEIINTTSYILQRNGLSAGLYYYELTNCGFGLPGTGKFIIE